MSNDLGLIYGLISTRRPSQIRYVGRTKVWEFARFRQHLRDAMTGRTSMLVHAWMRREYLAGYEIGIHTLDDDLSLDELGYYEGAWINSVPNLLNERRMGSGLISSKTIRKIKNTIVDDYRNYIYNTNGYLGIKYVRDIDSWTVTVCWPPTGYTVKFFIGEGDSKDYAYRTSEIYFSDFKSAIDERQRLRALAQSRESTPICWPGDCF